MRTSTIIKTALGSALVLSLLSCQTMAFYAQAVGGQIELMNAARPIDSWLHDEKTNPAVRDRLRHVAEIRDFASRELALPDNDSYRSYADLGRPYVVWNVFAAPELSLEPKRWCFLFAGCIAYRGYFSQEAAERFAGNLQGESFDVYVGGVPAYSTLGWFNDPVLSTFIGYPETEVARLMFHELAHQVVYVSDDTMFNESFATTVELEGVRRWLKAQGNEAQMQAFDAAQQRRREFLDLVVRTRESLTRVYAGDLAVAEKRAAKAQAFARMRLEYEALKESWGGFSGYEHWFQEPLNNAKLASVAAYTGLVPAFEALLAENKGDLKTFYAAIETLAKLPHDERMARFGALKAAVDHAS